MSDQIISKDGYENDIPMAINGKDIIFSQGEAEEIGVDVKNAIRSVKMALGENPATAQKANFNRPVDSIQSVNKNISSNPARLPRINELEDMAVKYPVGSLERKAIEEEINKLKQ